MPAEMSARAPMEEDFLFLAWDLTPATMVSLKEAKMLLKSPPKAKDKETSTSKAESYNMLSVSEASTSSSSGKSSSSKFWAGCSEFNNFINSTHKVCKSSVLPLSVMMMAPYFLIKSVKLSKTAVTMEISTSVGKDSRDNSLVCLINFKTVSSTLEDLWNNLVQEWGKVLTVHLGHVVDEGVTGFSQSPVFRSDGNVRSFDQRLGNLGEGFGTDSSGHSGDVFESQSSQFNVVFRHTFDVAGVLDERFQEFDGLGKVWNERGPSSESSGTNSGNDDGSQLRVLGVAQHLEQLVHQRLQVLGDGIHGHELDQGIKGDTGVLVDGVLGGGVDDGNDRRGQQGWQLLKDGGHDLGSWEFGRGNGNQSQSQRRWVTFFVFVVVVVFVVQFGFNVDFLGGNLQAGQGDVSPELLGGDLVLSVHDGGGQEGDGEVSDVLVDLGVNGDLNHQLHQVDQVVTNQLGVQQQQVVEGVENQLGVDLVAGGNDLLQDLHHGWDRALESVG
ncbi:hypothetical protein WICPIJ_006655 [Wickerhamomyces pijperi]|uniref:Uncharacterized protein n=1 Tax=Wickerhamomyces pijperi TaxID=599730 RepID=A0A9P8Q1N7_WICPI|nr:hypothetical protein WICPIJ_006655 [Wickerhamomyces pijperi]